MTDRISISVCATAAVFIMGACASPPKRELELGFDSSFVITESGRLFSWGSNTGGRLGRGEPGLTYLTPAEVIGPAVDWHRVAIGEKAAVGVSSSGHLYKTRVPVLSARSDDQPSDEARFVEVRIRAAGAGEWKDVAAGKEHFLAVAGDGEVFSWGSNDAGQLGIGPGTGGDSVYHRVEGIGPVVRSVAGYRHSLVVTEFRRIFTWGSNIHGQTGSGSGLTADLEPKEIPAPKGSPGWSTIVAAGKSHTIAVDESGILYGWGSNEHGQLCFDPATVPEVRRPRRITAWTVTHQRVADVAAGGNHTIFALRSGGNVRIFACGANDQGQLGLGHTEPVTGRVEILAAEPRSERFILEAGNAHSGYWSRGSTDAAGCGRESYLWGSNAEGQLGREAPSGNPPLWLLNSVDLCL